MQPSHTLVLRQPHPAELHAGAVGASVVYSLDEPWSFNTAVTLAGLQNAVPLPVSARGNASLVPGTLSTLPVAIYLNSMFQSEQDATAWALVNLYPACTDTAKRVATQVCSREWPMIQAASPAAHPAHASRTWPPDRQSMVHMLGSACKHALGSSTA